MIDEQLVELTKKLQTAKAANYSDAASNKLIGLLTPNLRKLVRSKIKNLRFLTDMNETTILNESFIRSKGFTSLPVTNRRVFFGSFATAVSGVVIDHIRSINRIKRKFESEVYEDEKSYDEKDNIMQTVLHVADALEALKSHDQELASLVALRYFLGFSMKDIALKTGISERSLDRKWAFARSWLLSELSD